MNGIASALIIFALLSTTTLAGVKSKELTFDRDVTVGGTLVKKGTYKVSFDEQSKELRITRRGKVFAQVPASLEDVERGLRFTPTFTSTKSDAGATIVSSITLGDKYVVIKSDKAAGAPASKAAGQ